MTILYQVITKNITPLLTHPVVADFVFSETGKHESSILGEKRSCRQLDQLHTANFGFC